MIQGLKNILVNNVKNIPGWRTNRKIVVIECDDWGGIRMPSASARKEMIRNGLRISGNRFDRYDTLANEEDLERMYEVLESVKDFTGNNAVMTPLVIVANPDFEKIKESNYSTYYHEPFPKTLKRYYPDQDVLKLWYKGLKKGLFTPGLHGRDHISVPFWMKILQEDNRELKTAFACGYVSLEVEGVPEPAFGFRAEYYFNEQEQKPALEQAIDESVAIFKDIFGHLPANFVPGNGFFHPDFDRNLVNNGIKYLNVMHRTPYTGLNGKLKYKRYISGQKGPGITYYTRNCAFEPTAIGYTGIENTLKQVAAAFRWGKPAIISTHRVNFVGAIDKNNREKGLTELKKLINAIFIHWPDIEFMSSGNALSALMNRNK